MAIKQLTLVVGAGSDPELRRIINDYYSYLKLRAAETERKAKEATELAERTKMYLRQIEDGVVQD